MRAATSLPSVPHAERRFTFAGRQLHSPDLSDIKTGDCPHRPEKLVDGVLSALYLNRDRPIGFIPYPARQAQPGGQCFCLPAEPNALDKSRKMAVSPDQRPLRGTGSMCDARLRAGVFQPLKQGHFLSLLCLRIFSP